MSWFLLSSAWQDDETGRYVITGPPILLRLPFTVRPGGPIDSNVTIFTYNLDSLLIFSLHPSVHLSPRLPRPFFFITSRAYHLAIDAVMTIAIQPPSLHPRLSLVISIRSPTDTIPPLCFLPPPLQIFSP